MIEVRGQDSAGNWTSTGFGQCSFAYDDPVLPGTFTILGVTGGSDGLSDTFLSANSWPTFSWTPSSGAVSYEVRVQDQAMTTDVCPWTVTPTSATTFELSGCTLVHDNVYRLSVRSRDFFGNSSLASNTNFSFSKDTQGPSITFSQPASNTTTGVSNYVYGWSATDSGSAGLAAAGTYFIEAFASAGCSGSPVSSSSSSVGSFDYQGLVLSSTYSIRVTAYDSLGNGGTPTCSSDVTRTVIPLTMTKVYPTNGANWMDWVTNDGTNFFDASGAACPSPTTPAWSVNRADCFHAGDKIKFAVTGRTSCANLTASDALGVFRWRCSAASGTATFFSHGFNYRKSLADLIDPTSWKSNSLTVLESGALIAQSSPGLWWTNTISDLPTNSNTTDAPVNLASSGTIYTLAADRQSSGYFVTADKIGIVTLNNSQLIYNERATDNCTYIGGQGSDFRCLIGFSSTNTNCDSNFHWIEGRFKGGLTNATAANAAEMVVTLGRTCFAVARNVSVSVGRLQGFLNYLTAAVYVDNLKASDVTSYGGFDTRWSWFNVSQNIHVTNSTVGIYVGSAGANSFSAINVHNTFYGLYFDGFDETYVGHVTSTNNFWTGINFHGASTANVSNVFNEIVVSNNNEGISISGDSNRFVDIVAVDHLGTGHDGILMTGSSNNVFAGYLAVGNNTMDCEVIGGTSPGLTHSTCTASGAQGSSTPGGAVLSTGRSVATAFKGKLSGPDSLAGGPSTAYGSILSFSVFENFFRGWGVNGSAFPNANNRDRCSSGNCHIWDWRLLTSDSSLRNRSGDFSIDNGAFVAGATCPSAVHGNQVETASLYGANTFLKNAIEILFDSQGDEDGLCESGENCLYAPNGGGYQGEGDFWAAGPCTFQGGTVTGVQLYAHPINGTL